MMIVIYAICSIVALVTILLTERDWSLVSIIMIVVAVLVPGLNAVVALVLGTSLIIYHLRGSE